MSTDELKQGRIPRLPPLLALAVQVLQMKRYQGNMRDLAYSDYLDLFHYRNVRTVKSFYSIVPYVDVPQEVLASVGDWTAEFPESPLLVAEAAKAPMGSLLPGTSGVGPSTSTSKVSAAPGMSLKI